MGTDVERTFGSVGRAPRVLIALGIALIAMAAPMRWLYIQTTEGVTDVNGGNVITGIFVCGGLVIMTLGLLP